MQVLVLLEKNSLFDTDEAANSAGGSTSAAAMLVVYENGAARGAPLYMHFNMSR